MMTEKHDVDELNPSDCKFVKYHPLRTDEYWKTDVILEAIDVKFEHLEVNGFSNTELEDIIEYLCCS